MRQSIERFLEFNGKTLLFLAKDGTFWIAIKPVCEALGIEYTRTFKNITSDPILGPALAKQPMQVPGEQTRNMVCLPENWRAFLSSYYKSPQASNVSEPMNTLTTRDRHQLITSFDHDVKIEDCYFRMLKPHEVKLGMAFDSDYIVLGDSRAQVRQLGNAVTPPVMEFIIDQVLDSLC